MLNGIVGIVSLRANGGIGIRDSQEAVEVYVLIVLKQPEDVFVPGLRALPAVTGGAGRSQVGDGIATTPR
jgi:hypothetical protein